MPNASWPASLPQYLLQGATDRREDATVRTGTDGGPAKVRRRYTSASRFLSSRMVLTTAQRATFDAFYTTTLKEGSLEFDWWNVTDGSAATFRFLGPPSFTIVGYADAHEPTWEAQLELELLP